MKPEITPTSGVFLEEQIKKIPVSAKRGMSSMNYLFLRAAIMQEEFPELITNEITFFLEGIYQDLSGKVDRMAFSLLYDYIFQELNEGTYLDDLDTFREQIKAFCNELDLDDEAIEKICLFYNEVAENVIDMQKTQDRTL